jgi:hypothetical protein
VHVVVVFVGVLLGVLVALVAALVVVAAVHGLLVAPLRRLGVPLLMLVVRLLRRAAPAGHATVAADGVAAVPAGGEARETVEDQGLLGARPHARAACDGVRRGNYSRVWQMRAARDLAPIRKTISQRRTPSQERTGHMYRG